MGERLPAVGVRAQELQHITLLKHRDGFARLDSGPFAIMYFSASSYGIFASINQQWERVTLVSFTLAGLAVLHLIVVLFTHWSINVREFVSCSRVRCIEKANMVKVVPATFSGTSDIVPLEAKVHQSDGNQQTMEYSFEFRKLQFVYNLDDRVFEKLKYPVKETFEYYMKANGYGTEGKVLAAVEKWGINKFEVPVPSFLSLLKEQMLAPFFVFQVLCVLLWCIDEYWYYSIFTFFMLVTFECTVVHQRLRNLMELRQLQTPKQSLYVFRSGKWELLPGDALVPGDIVSLARPSGPGSEEKVVPADCLLLAGRCIVEEAVLTGESTPQWKAPAADADPNQRLSLKRDRHLMLFGGTKLLQHTGDKAARIKTKDDGCLAIVLRTGFETSQGQLMRTILYSTERITANTLETGVFIAFLLIFAVSAAYYVLQHGWEDPNRNKFKLLVNCVMIITSVIPPELPMELTIAVNASLVALIKKRVFCTEPFRIPFAGKVEVACFDKTGTLTSDHLLLEGLAAVPGLSPDALASPPTPPPLPSGAASKGKRVSASAPSQSVEGDLLRDVRRAPRLVALTMAACQSLVHLQGEVIGDPLEKAAVEATGWVVSDSDVTLSPDRKTKATTLHRFHFNSSLKRMAVVVRVDDDAQGTSAFVVLAKGAPEVMKRLLAVPPQDYDVMHRSFAAQGARVIALAYRVLPAGMDGAAARSMHREDAESELEFGGFAVFQCPLKPESEPALAALDASNHQLVMITGDAPLTACFAANKVHIVTRDVLVLTHVSSGSGAAPPDPLARHHAGEPDSEYAWLSRDEATRLPFSRQWRDLLVLAAQYDLCVTGDALAHAEAIGVATKLIPLCQVFARVSPEQKELVLRALRAAGLYTLMCGDGTNDVGGLKAAHVGVALLAPKERPGSSSSAAAAAAPGPATGAAACGAVATGARRSRPTGLGAREPLAAAAGGQGGATGRGARPGVLAAVPSGRDVVPSGRGSPPAPAGTPAARGDKKPGRKPPGQAMLDEFARQGRPVPPHIARMAEWLDKMDADGAGNLDLGDVPLLKPGDASMAAAFTAKATGVMPCTDIIKQGRCTLVTTLQMFKILGLLCLSSAYTLSVMYLQGVKKSDYQATLTGVLTAAQFFFISSAKPLDTLSPVRPHPSIFCAYFFLSLLGQFAAHMAFLIYMYHSAVAAMPPEERQSTDAEFRPNLVNSVCYVVEAIVMVSTFAVNYVGHPFTTPLRQNKGMWNCIYYMGMFLVVLILDIIPGLGENFGMVKLPSDMAYKLLTLGVAMLGGTALWEQWLRRAFPARTPPRKGYMAHERELASITKEGKKRQ